ncbi:ANTAR domain-containing protein [Streptomyces sp. NPDC057616]|uniref:ANTAR domain-containing protein n=1 Tax=Streptomyces sp. NPDC057616 TaxID=3346183 RepID=UPI0036C9654A
MIGEGEDADDVTALQKEVQQLRHAVDAHALVDQAIGVVITVAGLRPDQGWAVLKHISQHTNVKLREVARCLVQWPSGGSPLPEVIRTALPQAVDHARRQDSDGSYEEDEEHAGAAACGWP